MITSFSAALMAFMEFTFFSRALHLRCINWSAFLYVIWTPFRFVSCRIFWRNREWWKFVALAYRFTKNSCTFITEFVCADTSPSGLETESFVHTEGTVCLTIRHFVCWANLGSSLNASIWMLFLVCDSVLFLWYFLVIYLVVLCNFKLCFRWALLLLILRNI